MMEVWFITGADHGIGAGIGRAVVRAGDHMVATGSNRDNRRHGCGLSAVSGASGSISWRVENFKTR